MIIAQKRRKENIVEYLLYMWQVEDLIRANNLSMDAINKNVVSQYGIEDETLLKEVCEWWDNLVEMMKNEKKEERGHLQVTQGLMNDIYNYHLYLLTLNTEIPYQNAFQTAWPDLEALMSKIPNGDKLHHVELALTAIYDYFLLKLQKKLILADTTNALMRISRFMAILSQKYLQAERELDKEMSTNKDGTLNDISKI
ncbi:MAG: DUF4924 family protein [Marinilabiliaceae bacterium]|nr:DUF4924 family protein [Marinilabiliaceae bacterium]